MIEFTSGEKVESFSSLYLYNLNSPFRVFELSLTVSLKAISKNKRIASSSISLTNDFNFDKISITSGLNQNSRFFMPLISETGGDFCDAEFSENFWNLFPEEGVLAYT